MFSLVASSFIHDSFSLPVITWKRHLISTHQFFFFFYSARFSSHRIFFLTAKIEGWKHSFWPKYFEVERLEIYQRLPCHARVSRNLKILCNHPWCPETNRLPWINCWKLFNRSPCPPSEWINDGDARNYLLFLLRLHRVAGRPDGSRQRHHYVGYSKIPHSRTTASSARMEQSRTDDRQRTRSHSMVPSVQQGCGTRDSESRFVFDGTGR